MNQHVNTLTRTLSGLSARITSAAYESDGFHACILPQNGALMPAIAQRLFDEGFFLSFVTACHTRPAIQVIYQFARFDENFRVMVRVSTDPENSIPSISGIYQGADWHERETRDFFGITFTDHPNPIPLILDDSDTTLRPLLKEEKKLKGVEEIFHEEEVAHV